MNLDVRGHYLNTLGIIEYIPRKISFEIEEKNVEHVQAVLYPERNSDVEIIASKTVETRSTEETNIVKSIVVNETIQEVKELVEVKLALWQPSEELLVCSAISGELPGSDQIQLLTNILLALGRHSGSLPQFELLQWPPFESIEGGEIEARDFISTFVSAKLESGKINFILLCGDSSMEWVLNGEQRQELSEGYLQVSENAKLAVIPSLTDMLDNSNLKRDAWQILQPHSLAKLA